MIIGFAEEKGQLSEFVNPMHYHGCRQQHPKQKKTDDDENAQARNKK